MAKKISHTYNSNEYNFTQFPDGNYEFEIKRIVPIEKPEYLYKYYPLSKNSISALVGTFLYASHPLQLNDKYDCSQLFVDISGHTLEDYLGSYLSNIYSKERITELYNNQRDELDKEFQKWEQVRLFQQFGVISMCENYNDILMWAYYAQNSGFLVKYRTDSLPRDIYGPYPINYVDEIEKINTKEKGAILSFLYQTNVKENRWENEKEWRYIYRNPKGTYHPFWSKQNISSRFKKYDIDSIEEIHLGYDFILPTEIDYADARTGIESIRFKTNHLDHKLKRSLLTFITKNNIKCYRILKNNRAFELGRQEIEITRLSSHKYEFKLGEVID
ncbi:hypothetical protein DMA11_14720 [Marinilabiliaceae bacterium JC017]|nr:hypothetical protein DMA11_14720 [Marinilabiliaceae bacterium JC017]